MERPRDLDRVTRLERHGARGAYAPTLPLSDAAHELADGRAGRAGMDGDPSTNAALRTFVAVLARGVGETEFEPLGELSEVDARLCAEYVCAYRGRDWRVTLVRGDGLASMRSRDGTWTAWF